MDRFFSIIANEKEIIYTIFGCQFHVKNPKHVDKVALERKQAIKIQNKFDKKPLKTAKKAIVFLTPGNIKINGGVMSIYSLCETSRELNPDSLCILSTYPNDKYLYATNDRFLNNEKIYRFSQIVKYCKNVEELILHIPEYYSKKFYTSLNKKDLKFLNSIKKIHINIMNQNIDQMPEKKELEDLFKITNNITQTLAHQRYATQEICNKWQIPTHLFSVYTNMSGYKYRGFDEKEKIIVLSPDKNEHKTVIVEKIKNKLNDWKIVTVKNLSFTEYMDLISRAFFTITFGEGYDGYFVQPTIVGSVGIAVYNDRFFPSKEWISYKNVFSSYEDLEEKIVDFIKQYSKDSKSYSELFQKNLSEHVSIYTYENFKDNLTRFYQKKYDFYPN